MTMAELASYTGCIYLMFFNDITIQRVIFKIFWNQIWLILAGQLSTNSGLSTANARFG